ncbi:MAG: hypothetical protein J6T10_10250 [Methanobrevibacter sp.]|nr:hypothetical protein [Methanobrevibacter sp.]
MPSKQYNLAQIPVNYAPGVYQGFSMNFKPLDVTPIAQSLDKIEARMNRAAEQQTAVDVALAKVESQLNPAEREWFAGYKQDIKNQIQGDIDAGNFGSAIRKATKLAGDVASDSRIIGRIEANAKYQEEIKKQKDRVARKEVSQDAFNWWLKQNEYNYEDKYDAAGNVVSGYEQKFTNLYSQLNIPGLAVAAVNMIKPQKGSTSTDGSTTVHNNTTGVLTRGGETYKPGEAINKSGHRSTSFEKISKDDLIANMQEIIALTPGGIEQIEQEYAVALDKFNDFVKQYEEAYNADPYSEETKRLGQQLEKRKDLLFKNGSETTYDDYFAKVITDNLFAQNLAYDWRNTSSGNTSSYSLSSTNNRNTGGTYGSSSTYFPGAVYNSRTQMFEAPMTQQKTNAEEIESENVAASDGILKALQVSGIK